MVVFKTKLRTDESLTIDLFQNMFLSYVKAVNSVSANGIQTFKDSNTKDEAEWFMYPEKNVFAGKRVFQQEKILYTESYVFNAAKHRLIATIEENILDIMMPVKPKFPGLFKTLMAENMIIPDDGMPAFGKNEVLLDMNVKNISAYLTNKKAASLPIIFIADHNKDVKRYIREFLFTAYIISSGPLEEASRAMFENRIIPDGMIGIYLPKTPKIITVNPMDYENEDACISSIKKMIDTMWIVKKGNPLDSYDGMLVQKLMEHNTALIKHTENKNVNDLYQMIEDLEKAVAEKSSTINALQAKVNGLETKLSMDGDKMLLTGDEKEWYQGEALDYVLSILTDALHNIPEDTREATILKDILLNNPYEKIHEERREKVIAALQEYRKMNNELMNDLNALGYSATTNGTHYKVIPFNDPRFMVMMSSTASNNFAGTEIARDINKYTN